VVAECVLRVRRNEAGMIPTDKLLATGMRAGHGSGAAPIRHLFATLPLSSSKLRGWQQTRHCGRCKHERTQRQNAEFARQPHRIRVYPQQPLRRNAARKVAGWFLVL
jgi:hypothetical protein